MTRPDESPTGARTDAALIAATLRGDAAAFDVLVRRHYRAAYVVALSVMLNRTDAEDVCHDAFVRSAARLEDCRDPDRFVHWLCAIARNHARNMLARRAVRRASQLDHTSAASDNDSARDAERSELRAQLEAALASLTPTQREVVLLHDLDDWTHESIAAQLGTSPGMSRQHLFHARRRLRQLLGAGLPKEYFNDR